MKKHNYRTQNVNGINLPHRSPAFLIFKKGGCRAGYWDEKNIRPPVSHDYVDGGQAIHTTYRQCLYLHLYQTSGRLDHHR